MLEWTREGAHRLFGSRRETGGETDDGMSATPNRQASPRGASRAFKRFLREFRSRNDQLFHEHTSGPRPA